MTRRRILLAVLFVLVACRSTPPEGGPFDTMTHAGNDDGAGFPAGVDEGVTYTSCEAPCTAFLPVAPSAGDFGWQALQDSFIDANGESCRVPVVLAMGQHATCYVDPDGALRCAGQIFNDVYGPTYTSTGLEDVTQILLVVGDAGCALAGGVPTCLGDYNYSGQLGNGGRGSSETWTPWAAGGEGFRALTTGTSDSYCAINDRAEVWCTGYDYGFTPILADGGPTSAVWISTFGETYLDDGVTFRASQARTECVVTAHGLACPSVGITVGRPGHVVDGALIGTGDSTAGQLVWLEDDGRVQVYTFVEGGLGVATTLFDALPVLAIATNYYTDSVCAVYNDGSIVCVGTNDQGKLATGDTDRLATPKVTQPAGTIDLTCR